jgi:4-hydroxy-tetrahydrodipicolinate synthase
MNSPALTQGIVCALWTPLTADGHVDHAALEAHLEWLSPAGLDGFLILGSTGRFPMMPIKCREDLTGRVLAKVHRQPVLVNVSHLDARKVARLGVHACENGAAGITVLPPWYYEQAQADLVEWFVAAGRAAGLPLWLYSFPERTGNRIDLNTVKE